MANFDQHCLTEFIRDVENETAEFIGKEFCAARLIGYISSQKESGLLSEEQAAQLLDDANHLWKLAEMGHKYAKLARTPSAEMETIVLSNYRKQGGTNGR